MSRSKGMLVILFALLAFGTSCSKQGNPAAEKADAKTFATPTDAGAAILDAANTGDPGALLPIFGADAKSLLFSGDEVKDKMVLKDFVAAYSQMHRWVNIKAGGQILVVGADNYPFPIPLVKNTSGQWYFNAADGKDEILARRIGKGELTAIGVAIAVGEAQQQYYGQLHDGSKVKEYAQRFGSDEGKQNGLYWAVAEGQPPSPLGVLGDFAKSVGYTSSGDKPQPFNGYYYRILTKQGDKAEGGAKDYLVNGRLTGGFAILAYPAEYRNSGIMTFIVGQDCKIYQKDLGEKTADVAAALAEYNPGDGWTPAI
jgi:hypothetical protein